MFSSKAIKKHGTTTTCSCFLTSSHAVFYTHENSLRNSVGIIIAGYVYKIIIKPANFDGIMLGSEMVHLFNNSFYQNYYFTVN